MLLVLVVAPVPQGRPTLDAKHQRIIRDAVYGKKAKIDNPRFADIDEVVVPKELAEVYAASPRATVELLRTIVEGANPNDSVVAAAYGLALIHGGGAVCLKYFDARTYDDVDEEGWKVTPRRHWVEKIQELADEKLPEKK